MSDCFSPPYSLVCLRQNEPSLLLLCRGTKTVVDKPKGQQTPDQSAHSRGAGVTQERKCLASSGGCNKIPEHYISAIQANPQCSVIYYVFYLAGQYSLVDGGRIVSGDLHGKKHLILSQPQTSGRTKH